MKFPGIRIAALVVVPLATLVAGLAIGYYAGRFAPSERWLFGQFADRIVLAERMRAGDQRGYELMAVPSISMMSLQLGDAGYFHDNADPRVEEFVQRALALLEQARSDVSETQLHSEAIDTLRRAQPKVN